MPIPSDLLTKPDSPLVSWRLFAFSLLASLAALTACAGLTAGKPRDLLKGLDPGAYAIIATNYGPIVARLFADQAPRTAANFIGLAEGVQPFIEIGTLKTVRRPFYDGLIFHRVDWQMLIQGGDPVALGTGGPGYTIPRESHPDLNFNVPGILAMAGRGAGGESNGSQFFITARPLPEFNGLYSVFGQVVRGLEVVQAMSGEPVQLNHFPVRTQRMISIRIYRVASDGSLAKSPPPPDVDIGIIPMRPSFDLR